MKKLAMIYCLVFCFAFSAYAAQQATEPKTLDRPLIADIQQCFCVTGTSDNHGLGKNTFQFWFRVKVAATNLVFPLAQTYSDWNNSELQTEFSNAATYRAAISLNKGPWTQLTWGGEMSKECAFRAMILNDPVALTVKAGDVIYVRTEISVPKGGKWGANVQSREVDEKNWTQGGTNSAADVLTANNADFSPLEGLFIHTALGVFGTPIAKSVSHPTVLVGDSIAPYVLDAALAVGAQVPLANVSQPAETAERFARAGQIRQSLFAGCDTMLYEDGINDMRNHATFEQLKEASSKIWESFRTKGGKRLIVFTLTPLTRSTDKWRTEIGQSPEGDPTQRQLWNDYLRHLTVKDVKMAVTVIDTAALLESSPKSSFWKTLPNGAYTDDGVHPNEAGYAYLAKEIAPLIKHALLEESKETPKP